MQWIRKQFKRASLAVIAVMLCSMLSAQLSWQCPNGTPCPDNCPMLASKLTSTTVAVPKCSHCPTENLIASADQYDTSISAYCKSSKCILKSSDKLEAVRSDVTKIPVENPGQTVASGYSFKTESEAIYYRGKQNTRPPPLSFRPDSPRAPPIIP